MVSSTGRANDYGPTYLGVFELKGSLYEGLVPIWQNKHAKWLTPNYLSTPRAETFTWVVGDNPGALNAIIVNQPAQPVTRITCPYEVPGPWLVDHNHDFQEDPTLTVVCNEAIAPAPTPTGAAPSTAGAQIIFNQGTFGTGWQLQREPANLGGTNTCFDSAAQSVQATLTNTNDHVSFVCPSPCSNPIVPYQDNQGNVIGAYKNLVFVLYIDSSWNACSSQPIPKSLILGAVGADLVSQTFAHTFQSYSVGRMADGRYVVVFPNFVAWQSKDTEWAHLRVKRWPLGATTETDPVTFYIDQVFASNDYPQVVETIDVSCLANMTTTTAAGPCDTTAAPAPSPTTTPGNGKGKKILGGLVAGGIIAGAIGAAVMAKSTTTAAPGPVTTTSVTQGAQTNAPQTTTTKNSSSDLLWLWILLGILALCCLLSLCGGGLAACMGGKKKKKKSKRATRVNQPSPEPVLLPVVEEQQELLPMVPPLMEPYPMTSMAAPTMVETVQMIPTATPTMVETVVPMLATAPTAMPAMQMAAPAMLGEGFGMH